MSGDEMEELRLGAAASVDRGLAPQSGAKYIYQSECQERPRVIDLRFTSSPG